jgi:tRNA uridine 5-carboxymethylaminomethyl modification enzyme
MSASLPIIVVGAGHAGCEAALAAARLGADVVILTLRVAHVGRLSCNPAVGGLAKGCLVREIDAMGGAMAVVADRSAIQFRRLNTRRGLAVQSSRAQVDIDRYPAEMAAHLAAQPRLRLLEGEAAEVLLGHDGRVRGLRLGDGSELLARAVILTTGTFLHGVLHRGTVQEPGGRVGDSSAARLSANLRALGLRLGRLKTGTTPRLDGRTIDWSRLEVQEDTEPGGHFSFTPPPFRLPQIDCHVAWTHEATHELIRDNLHQSPMYSGHIEGRGPRYCPSIEDKVVRFADKDRHQLFLEPEGLNTHRVYVNGLSTSLPADVQLAAVRTIAGLERAEIEQYGYAVEYDYSDPLDLGADLQHRGVPGLYLAGQVNGTSGYEEAAAQGLWAGIAAVSGEAPAIGRDQAYLAVLVDDLVSRGIGGEPYRMFSSRAEHRLLLREDNADRRLMPLAQSLGLLADDVGERFARKCDAIEIGRSWAVSVGRNPDADAVARFGERGLAAAKNRFSPADLLRRPDVGWDMLDAWFADRPDLDPAAAEQVETDLRYEGYLTRERARAAQTRRLEGLRLPPDMDLRIPGISFEVAERLVAARPATLGAAARLVRRQASL